MPKSQDQYNRQILEAIASGERVTQRGLASGMGVALGLTNLLIRRLVAKGYVKVSRLGRHNARYLLTVAGWEALGRATHASLENTLHLYTETRERIWSGLSEVSRVCPPGPQGQKRIVFYGAGDIAEIAYVSLQRTDLTLVGVVDDRRTGHFFNLPIHTPEALTPDVLGGVDYAHVVVTSVRHGETIGAKLAARDIPRDRVSFIQPRVSELVLDGAPGAL